MKSNFGTIPYINLIIAGCGDVQENNYFTVIFGKRNCGTIPYCNLIIAGCGDVQENNYTVWEMDISIN